MQELCLAFLCAGHRLSNRLLHHIAGIGYRSVQKEEERAEEKPNFATRIERRWIISPIEMISNSLSTLFRKLLFMYSFYPTSYIMSFGSILLYRRRYR